MSVTPFLTDGKRALSPDVGNPVCSLANDYDGRTDRLEVKFFFKEKQICVNLRTRERAYQLEKLRVKNKYYENLL